MVYVYTRLLLSLALLGCGCEMRTFVKPENDQHIVRRFANDVLSWNKITTDAMPYIHPYRADVLRWAASSSLYFRRLLGSEWLTSTSDDLIVDHNSLVGRHNF